MRSPVTTDTAGRAIPNTHSIIRFFHCGLCGAEKPATKSLQEYSRLEVGFTELGIQVWCIRHKCNVVHVDFEGKKLPANMTRKP
jgi:hypothetical protein